MTYTRPALGDPGNSGPTSAVTIIDALSDGLEAVEYGIFNVRAYGATGDGTTNDTTAINSAIAALNAAGKGVLYFPPGDYSTTGGLTTITAACTVMGDGCGDALGANVVSKVKSSSATANLFTVTTRGTRFIGLGLFCTAATPTAGAGIRIQNVSSGVGGGDGNRYRDLALHHFYINLDVTDGAEWYMDSCFFYNPVKYNVKIQHVDLVDGGDQSIVNCQFVTRSEYSHNPDAHVRQESGGGLKVANCKFNGQPGFNAVAHCIDLAIGAGVNTSVMVIGNNSFENYTAGGIRVVQSSSGAFAHMVIQGNEFAPYSLNATAVSLAGTSTTNFGDVVIVANEFVGQSGTGTGVSLVNVNGATVGPNHYAKRSGVTLGATVTTSGCINVRNFDALA